MKWEEVFTPPDSSIIDFETSGLKPELNHIIEVGLLEIRENQQIGPNSWIVNPNFPEPFHITEEITEITGISDTEITYGADPTELFPSLIQRIRWLPIWGHNLLRFDLLFINEECNRVCVIPPPKGSWFDTAAIFKAYQLSLPDQKWTREPYILDTLEDYNLFYDWGMMVLNKPIRGLYYNLPHTCKTLGVDTSDIKFHRAGGDVVATYRVREALKKIILG